MNHNLIKLKNEKSQLEEDISQYNNREYFGERKDDKGFKILCQYLNEINIKIRDVENN